MLTALGLTAIVLTALASDTEVEFLARVEQTEWLDSRGKPLPRIERDDDGNVKKLWLSGMTLSSDNLAAIGRLKTLRNLDLSRTNITDATLKPLLEQLPQLQGLNLTSTEITDSSIDEILKLESLRSLCLGNVGITPQAVARLKETARKRTKPLSLGYFQRK